MFKKSIKISIPYHHQTNGYFCGPAALEIVFDYFKKHVSQKSLGKLADAVPVDGTKHADMIRVATEKGFYVYVNEHSSLFEIMAFLEKKLPVIVNFIEPSLNEGHFAVVSGMSGKNIVLQDPWNGKNFTMKSADFLKRWHDEKSKQWIMVISNENFNVGKQYLPKKPA